jgi:hypothetical protein
MPGQVHPRQRYAIWIRYHLQLPRYRLGSGGHLSYSNTRHNILLVGNNTDIPGDRDSESFALYVQHPGKMSTSENGANLQRIRYMLSGSWSVVLELKRLRSWLTVEVEIRGLSVN